MTTESTHNTKRQRFARTRAYRLLGTLLTLSGVLLGVALCVQIWADVVQARAVETAGVEATVADAEAAAATAEVASWPPLPRTQPIAFPLATSAQPTTAAAAAAPPTTAPTPVPLRPLAVRLEVPSIDVDSPIVETKPVSYTTWQGEERWEWPVADYAVGQLSSSGRPGAGRNIVLAGHNNTRGQVFRRLPDVEVGDVLTLHTALATHRYEVVEKRFVTYRTDREEGERIIQRYFQPGSSERVTLQSCWPYWNSADRILVVAEPLAEETASQPR